MCYTQVKEKKKKIRANFALNFFFFFFPGTGDVLL